MFQSLILKFRINLSSVMFVAAVDSVSFSLVLIRYIEIATKTPFNTINDIWQHVHAGPELKSRYKDPNLADALKVKDLSLKILFMSGYTDGAFRPSRSLHKNEKVLPKPATNVGLLGAVYNLVNTQSRSTSRTVA